jgi:AcrR family transcriptional regulator
VVCRAGTLGAWIRQFREFTSAASAEAARLLSRHSELLSNNADELLGRRIQMAEIADDVRAVTLLRRRPALVHRCWEVGVAAALAEPEADDDAELAATGLAAAVAVADQLDRAPKDPSATDREAAVTAWQRILRER